MPAEIHEENGSESGGRAEQAQQHIRGPVHLQRLDQANAADGEQAKDGVAKDRVRAGIAFSGLARRLNLRLCDHKCARSLATQIIVVQATSQGLDGIPTDDGNLIFLPPFFCQKAGKAAVRWKAEKRGCRSPRESWSLL